MLRDEFPIIQQEQFNGWILLRQLCQSLGLLYSFLGNMGCLDTLQVPLKFVELFDTRKFQVLVTRPLPLEILFTPAFEIFGKVC